MSSSHKIIICIGVVVSILEGNAIQYGDLTFYYLGGSTACGVQPKNNDLVASVALVHFKGASFEYSPSNSLCGQTAVIIDPTSDNNVTVRIADICRRCKINDIDVSLATFKRFKPLSVGRFKVFWYLE